MAIPRVYAATGRQKRSIKWTSRAIDGRCSKSVDRLRSKHVQRPNKRGTTIHLLKTIRSEGNGVTAASGKRPVVRNAQSHAAHPDKRPRNLVDRFRTTKSACCAPQLWRPRFLFERTNLHIGHHSASAPIRRSFNGVLNSLKLDHSPAI